MTTHEAYAEHSATKTSSDRGFGLTVGGIVAAIGLLRSVLGAHGFDAWSIGMIAVGAGLIAVAFARASLLAPLNRGWTKLGFLMFRIVNPIVLFLIFITAVVPTAMVMRLLGHDLLRLRREDEAKSYWIERDSMRLGPQNLHNQF